MTAAPRRPLALRVLNAVGDTLRSAGLPLVSLEPQALLARASRTTGLTDFGDDRFREPLRRLVDALEREAALTVLGRLIARADLVRLLENRLRIHDTLKRHPEITARPIRRPLFIVGLPRTGTTILHELLAQDPVNRVPLTWEAQYPWPPPERATYDEDPRIARVAAHFRQIDRVLPGFQAMHPMGPLLPQECVALTAHELATMIFHSTHDVPSYEAWLERADLRWVYASHRRQLQYLQWQCPAERWALKSPAHLWALGALLAVYPDACLVQTHRDPLRVVASLTSLITLLRSMASDRVDSRAIAADWTARLAEGLRRMMDARDRGLLAPEQVCDVQFDAFMRDAVGTIARVYRHFGWELTDEARGRMERYLAAHPRDRHGAHRYRFALTGLDLAAERRRYADYQERHRVPSEPVD